MNLYLPMPLSKFHFGPAATSLIRLSDHGIMDLEDDIFYLSEYGVVRCTITPIGFKCSRYGIVRRTVIPFGSELYESLIGKKHFNYINHLHSVSCLISPIQIFILITWSNSQLCVLIFNDLI